MRAKNAIMKYVEHRAATVVIYIVLIHELLHTNVQHPHGQFVLHLHTSEGKDFKEMMNFY